MAPELREERSLAKGRQGTEYSSAYKSQLLLHRLLNDRPDNMIKSFVIAIAIALIPQTLAACSPGELAIGQTMNSLVVPPVSQL